MGGHERYFYTVKIIRIIMGLKIFNISDLMHNVHGLAQWRLDKIIREYKMIAED